MKKLKKLINHMRGRIEGSEGETIITDSYPADGASQKWSMAFNLFVLGFISCKLF